MESRRSMFLWENVWLTSYFNNLLGLIDGRHPLTINLAEEGICDETLSIFDRESFSFDESTAHVTIIA
jgi:hypothetical protein